MSEQTLPVHTAFARTIGIDYWEPRVAVYRSGNNPGIHSLANLAGKLSLRGARWVSDFSAPTASSSDVTFRA